MAYSTSTPAMLISGFNGEGGKIWVHKSADAAAAVDTAGFISNGHALGMKVGDTVIHTNTANGNTSFHAVQSVTVGGSVDLFDAAATASTDTD